MNILYLLRHAQAEPGRDYDDDRDRPLTDTGRRDAGRLGRLLAATDQLPDGIVTSTAVRARQTANALSDGGHWAVEVPLRSSHALYQAQPADVLEEIQSLPDELGAVLLVGHEPAWSTTVSRLLGSANISLPTGTCVRIDTADQSWGEVQFGDGMLRWMLPPSLLR
jgi:phosphohistidine phosphatase